MLNIYIARHGQNIDNLNGILNGHRDEPLTEKGLEQAHDIANKIRERGIVFDAIYASPLSRAFETAKIISEATESPRPQAEALLIERDFGIMTGKHHSEIEKYCAPDIIKAEIITYFLNPEGAETFPDLIKRAHVLIRKIKEKHASGHILLTTHGDIGKMIYAAYYELDWKEVLTRFHFGNCDLLLMSKDSKPEDAHVFKVNQCNH